MLVAEHQKRKGKLILQIKGELDGSSAIQLGTLLEEAANSHITHLTLDFSQVLDFEYTGIALSLAVFEFYVKDFSNIICCGFPVNIIRIFKGLGAEKIPSLKVAHHCDNVKDLMVSNF